MNLHTGSDQNTSETSATRLAFNKLRDLILSGELAPGEKLKIDTLRDTLGMGASPIREALSLLTSDKLVVRHDQRGFRTADTSRENFEEILELRCEIESLALRKSIETATDEWAEQIVLAHYRMTRAQDSDDKDFETLHKQFHMTLIGNCQSPILMGFCGQLYDLNIRYRFIAARAAGYAGRNIGDEHQRILDAAIARDANAACNLLCVHYKTTGAFVAKFIS